MPRVVILFKFNDWMQIGNPLKLSIGAKVIEIVFR